MRTNHQKFKSNDDDWLKRPWLTNFVESDADELAVESVENLFSTAVEAASNDVACGRSVTPRGYTCMCENTQGVHMYVRKTPRGYACMCENL